MFRRIRTLIADGQQNDSHSSSMQRVLKFVIPEDTVTIDMEVMTLKGIHIFRQDRHSNEKNIHSLE